MKRDIHFQMEEDLFNRFKRIPWGLRASVLRTSVETAICIYERHGIEGIGAFLDQGNKRFVQNLNNNRSGENK